MNRAFITFRERLAEVKTMWRESYTNLAEHPEIGNVVFRINDFITNASISESCPSPSGSSRFEINETDQTYRFTDRFLNQWESYCNDNTSNDFEKNAIYDLFLLHEAVHPEQGITGIRHSDAGEAPSIISALDYEADAFAVIALHILYKTNEQYQRIFEVSGQLRDELAWNIKHLILHMQVFNYEKTREQKYEIVNGLRYSRFQRYLQWHFNYSRAIRYRGKTSDGLRLMRQPHLDIVFGAIPKSMEQCGITNLDNAEHWPLDTTKFQHFKRWLDETADRGERNHSAARLLLIISDPDQAFATYRREITVLVLHEYMNAVVHGQVDSSIENFFRDMLHSDHPELLEATRNPKLDVLYDIGIDISCPWNNVARLHAGVHRCEVLTRFCEQAKHSLRTTRYSKRPIGSTEKSKKFEDSLNEAIRRLEKTGTVQRIICINHDKKREHIDRLYQNHDSNRALALFWTVEMNPFELFIVDDEIALLGLTFPGIEAEQVDDWWIEIRNKDAVRQLINYYDNILRPPENESCLKKLNERFRNTYHDLIYGIQLDA